MPFEAVPLRDAVIHSSDGRVGRHVDDFLSNGLGLTNYDRVALPGGPACFAGHPAAHVQQANVVEELRFLVEAHELERVVLGLVYGAQPVTWEVTASRLTLQGEQYGLGLVGG